VIVPLIYDRKAAARNAAKKAGWGRITDAGKVGAREAIAVTAVALPGSPTLRRLEGT